VTLDVGPRVIRCGFIGKRNLMAEMKPQLGGVGEREWKIRGGHRLWIAPEEKPLTYELDNGPVEVTGIAGGIRTRQDVGSLSGVRKSMDIRMEEKADAIRIRHVLRNEGRRAVDLAPWALSVMAPGGMAIIPLPAKIPHTERLTHNQQWSLWGYTDLSDPRWTIGTKYLFFRQDRRRGPSKLGIAHREGWVGYQLGEFVFIKELPWDEKALYPDGGMNFETFSNEDFLEVESLGPLVRLKPGQSVSHEERWSLYAGVPRCTREAQVDRFIRRRMK
jgi:hypothetical protein